MVGRQIRLGGLMYPYYTIVGFVSSTALLLDAPWAGPEQTNVPYQMLQCYFPVPSDFGYWVVVVSPRDGYRLSTELTQGELGAMDAQRTWSGQTYAVSFRDWTSQYGGVIGPVLPVNQTGAAPISTTTTGYTYVTNASYIVRVTGTGASGTATWDWMRVGESAFTPPGGTVSANTEQDLMDGVQVYWPDGVTYNTGDFFIINCQSGITSGTPRYELWPSPASSAYLYPYIYTAKEYDLSMAAPQLPPFIANRGEVLLEMGLEKAATYPGPDADHLNPYFNLGLCKMHQAKAEQLIDDLERNDEETGVTNIEYQNYPYYPAPWGDGNYRQHHAPFIS